MGTVHQAGGEEGLQWELFMRARAELGTSTHPIRLRAEPGETPMELGKDTPPARGPFGRCPAVQPGLYIHACTQAVHLMTWKRAERLPWLLTTRLQSDNGDVIAIPIRRAPAPNALEGFFRMLGIDTEAS